MGIYSTLSSILLVAGVLHIFFYGIQVECQGQGPESNIEVLNNNEKQSYTIPHDSFPFSNGLPDVNGGTNLVQGAESMAMEVNGFDWRDVDFSQNGKCEIFGMNECAIKGYLDPLLPNVKEPIDSDNMETGTILMKLAGGRGAIIKGASPTASLYAIKHSSNKLTGPQASIVLKEKKKFVNKENIRVVANELYDADSYPQEREPSFFKNHEVLQTSPYAYDEKHPIVNGKDFVVGDAMISKYSTYLVINAEIPSNCAESIFYPPPISETYKAAYLASRNMVFHTFQKQNGSLLLPTEQKLLNTVGDFLLPKITTSSIFLQCIGVENAYCLNVVGVLRSYRSIEAVFVITDNVEQWIAEFTMKNNLNLVVMEYEEVVMKNSSVFKHLRQNDLTFEWKMDVGGWYPNPKLREGFFPTSKWTLDILAIGGEFYKGDFQGESNTASSWLGSSASMANARFAAMLTQFVKKKMMDPDMTLASIPRAEAIEYNYVRNLAITTASPYIYEASVLPSHLLTAPFGNEASFFSGDAMPVIWQGAGLVNLRTMMLSKIRVSPTKLDLGSVDPTAKERFKVFDLELENRSDAKVVYNVENVKAVTLEVRKGENRFIMKKTPNLSLSMQVNLKKCAEYVFIKSISIPPKKKATFTIKLELPIIGQTDAMLFFSGYIKLYAKRFDDEKLSNVKHVIPDLHIPYLWVYGKR